MTISNRIQSQQFYPVTSPFPLGEEHSQQESLPSFAWAEPLEVMLAAVEDKAQAIAVLKLALLIDLRLAAKLAGAVKPAYQPQAVALISQLEIPQPLKFQLLALTRSASAIPELAKALRDTRDRRVCRAAVEALGNIGGEEAAAALFETLSREKGELCELATAALAQLDSDAAMSVLSSALTDEDAAIRDSAATALAAIASPAAVRALLHAAAAAECDIRATATAALSQIRAETAVPLLARALSNADYKVCQSVAEALGAIASEQAIPALIQTLTRSNFYAKIAAADALGKIGSPEATPHLLAALRDETAGVRCRAAAALGAIGCEVAIPALVTALEDEDASVRASAAAALENFTADLPADTRIPAASDESAEVRASAAAALGKADIDREHPNFAHPCVRATHRDENYSVLGDRVFAGMLSRRTKLRGSLWTSDRLRAGAAQTPGLCKLFTTESPTTCKTTAKAIDKITRRQQNSAAKKPCTLKTLQFAVRRWQQTQAPKPAKQPQPLWGLSRSQKPSSAVDVTTRYF